MDWNKKVGKLSADDIDARKVDFMTWLDIEYDDENFWANTLTALKNSNKYYVLAKAMEDTRGNWKDGCGSVEDALRTFTIENDLDQKIYDEIYGLCYDWDRDGRVFRDCEYNYNYIFNNCMGQEFCQKLSFVRKMFTEWCQQNGQEIRRYDSDYDVDSESSDTDNE